MLGRLTIALWMVSIAVGYLVLAGRVGQAAEGMDRGRLSYWPVGIQLAAVGVASLSTLIWAFQRARRTAHQHGVELGPLGTARRSFLTGAGAVTAGVAATGGAVLARVQGWFFVTGSNIFFAKVEEIDPNPRPAWKGARIQTYRRLGRTDARVSDISLGSGVITLDGGGEALARQAIERGINYFDTSPDYSGASSEIALGRALAGQREKIFLATKWCTPDGHLPAGSSVQAYMDVVEASLARLQTSYVDLVHVHACDEIERLSDPNLHEAFRRLRDAGKVRFLGVSSHTPNLEAVADYAISDGRFDVLMLAYHHGAYPRLAEIIDRAAKADLGVVAMKTLKGAKQRSFDVLRDAADSYAQAAFKWVLSNPSVSCLVISFWEPAQLDEYLYASGRAPTSKDLALLRTYDELIAGTHCFAHCGACLDSCPEDLAINDVLRHRMYFEDYGQQKYAMSLYAKLEKQADVCIGCAAPCVGSCPHGIPIQERTTGAHRLLTLV